MRSVKRHPPGPPHPADRAKLADVARRAGVSLSTASRVMNNPGIVRTETRERVRTAVAALGFSPDSAARALALGRSRTVGAVVPTLGIAIFAEGVEALQDRLSQAGYTLLLANSQYDPVKEEQEIRVLLERGADGLALVGGHLPPASLRLIAQHGVPAVTTYVARARSGIPAVGIDNAAASRELAEYLLSLGHRTFGIIANTAMPNDRTQARRDGIMRALAKAGVMPRPEQVEEIPYSVASARVALRRLLDRSPRITAVMCTADALAIGATSECRRLGLSVPADISITGFDDVDLAAEDDPSLTTVHVPAREIGRLAADRLLDALADRPVPTETRLEARLVIRGSTGPAAKPRQRASSRLGKGLKRSGKSTAQSASAK